MKTVEHLREYRRRLAERGLCIGSAKHGPSEAPSLWCRACLERNNERAKLRRGEKEPVAVRGVGMMPVRREAVGGDIDLAAPGFGFRWPLKVSSSWRVGP